MPQVLHEWVKLYRPRDECDRLVGAPCEDRFDHFRPGMLGHDHVRQDKINLFLVCQKRCESGLAVGRLQRSVPVLMERHKDVPTDDRIVIHD